MLKSMTEGRGAYNTAWRCVIKQKILLLLVLAKFVINYTSNSESLEECFLLGESTVRVLGNFTRIKYFKTKRDCGKLCK
ncbi:hypothetical protein QQP08_009478 [Theobroma cacao]|nr:hypothetical protein QQP08_009478 [Theobroma cacao]